MQITVIIPTIDRAEALQNVLHDLAAQELLPHEVFVIDQGAGSTERTETLIDSVPVYWLIQQPPNASVARNTAARRASAEWLLYLDDDVRFDATLLSQYAAVVEQYAVDACTGGVLGPRDSWSVEPKPEADGRWIAEWRILSSYRTTQQSLPVRGACSANFLVRREALFAVGGFDERYYGICEDSELGFRLSQAGWRVWHDPRPWVHHLMIPSGGSRRKELVKQEQNLSLIYPRTMSLHLLMLLDHFGYLTTFKFFIFRLTEYLILRKNTFYMRYFSAKTIFYSLYIALKLRSVRPDLPLYSDII